MKPKVETDEELVSSAARFTTRGAWLKTEPAQYLLAKRRGVFDRAVAHMPAARKVPRAGILKITEDQVRAAAAKYTRRVDWMLADLPTYRAAKNRKLLGELCAHMSAPGAVRKPRNDKGKPNINRREITDEELAVAAAKYTSRSEWIRQDRRTYTAAARRKLLDKIASHQFVCDPLNDWKVYVYILPTNLAYVGVTSVDLASRHLQHVTGKSSVRKVVKELIRGKIVPPDYVPNFPAVVDEGVHLTNVYAKEDEWLEKYRAMGYTMINKARPGGIGRLYRMRQNVSHGPNRVIHLLTGVSGIGKTWVVRQLREQGVKFFHIDFDSHGWLNAYTEQLTLATKQEYPILLDTPIMVKNILSLGLKKIHLYIIDETEEVFRKRLADAGRGYSARSITRLERFRRLKEVFSGGGSSAFMGTSQEVLDRLKQTFLETERPTSATSVNQ